jgi:hypothetical protein
MSGFGGGRRDSRVLAWTVGPRVYLYYSSITRVNHNHKPVYSNTGTQYLLVPSMDLLPRLGVSESAGTYTYGSIGVWNSNP